MKKITIFFLQIKRCKAICEYIWYITHKPTWIRWDRYGDRTHVRQIRQTPSVLMNEKMYIMSVARVDKMLGLICIFYCFHIYIYYKNMLDFFPSKSSAVLSTILLQILIHKCIIQVSRPLDMTDFYQLDLITN